MLRHNSYLAKFVLLAALAIAPFQSAYCIGKIGNKTVLGDTVEGFTAQIPNTFPMISNMQNRSAQLQSDELLVLDQDTPAAPLTMVAMPFSAYFNGFVPKSESELSDYLKTKYGFNLQSLPPNKQCAKVLFGENEVGYIGVVEWNSGHGYAVTVQKTKSEIGRGGVLEILKSTVIDQPCSQ